MCNSLLSRKEKYTVAVLSCVAFALRVPLAFRPERALAGPPYGDDAYYLFSIARNVAAGHGPSVDGIHLTNGFQPLILLFYTPIFWLTGSPMIGHGNAWLAVRWTFILNGVIAMLTVWAVALLMRALERIPQKNGITAPIIAAAIWTFTFEIIGQMTNGLETGLYSLILIAAITMYVKIGRDEASKHIIPTTRWVVFGIVLGLAVLARIDAAILVAIIVLTLLWQKRWRPAMITGCVAMLVSAPWWIFNVIYFGSLMPTSGQAENSWPLPPWGNIHQAIKAISDILMLIFYLPGSIGLTALVLWTILLIFAIAFIWYRTTIVSTIRSSFRLNGLLPFLLFSIALILYYTVLFKAPHFIARYLQPARILWSLILAALASVLWERRIVRPVLIGIAILGLVFTIRGYTVLYYFSDEKPAGFYEMGIWAKQHPGEKIAMLQSGIASFIAPNIINLDGKVNTDALLAHQQGRLAGYLRDEHFTYIADDKPFIEDIAILAKKDELYYDSSGMIDEILLMKHRMTKP